MIPHPANPRLSQANDTWQDDMRNMVRPFEGWFTGQLDEAERRIFDDACNEGLARRSYEGAAGFMGLARVRLAKVEGQEFLIREEGALS